MPLWEGGHHADASAARGTGAAFVGTMVVGSRLTRVMVVITASNIALRGTLLVRGVVVIHVVVMRH